MTIGIWGDSITFGSCDNEALGWAGRLRRTLPINDDNQLYNFGICGETTQDLINRFAVEAKATEPDKIIFAIGLNDSKLPYDSSENLIPIATFTSNLIQLITAARAYTKDITFIGLTSVDDKWRSVRGSRFLNQEVMRYDEAIKDLAGEHKLIHIPMTAVLNPAHDLADGLHPNAAGYQKMFEHIREHILF